MVKKAYLMEGDEEAVRLDIKTDPRMVEEQARWAGVVPGMRIADLGCGSGKTTFILNQMAQPGGKSVGVDIAEQRSGQIRRRRTQLYPKGCQKFPGATGAVRSCLDPFRTGILQLQQF